MANKHREPLRKPRRLRLAAVLLGVATLLLYLIFDGVIFRATQGAGIGLYASVLVMIVGFVCAGWSVLIAGRAVFRPRHVHMDVIKLADQRRDGGRHKAA